MATPSRSTVFNRAQIGLEADGTPGTAATVTKKMLASGIRFNPNIPVAPFRAQGSRFGIVSPTQKEFSEGTLQDGPINLAGDIVYWLASLLKRVIAPTTEVWTFDPSTYDPNTIATYTLERGTGSTGQKFTFVTCSGLSFTFSREASNVSGTFFGKKMAVNQAMTTSGVTGTSIALAQPGNTTVKIGSSIAGLTKITDCLSANFGITGVYSPNFFLDESLRDFNSIKALAPSMTAGIVIGQGSNADAYLANYRNGDLLFAEITAFSAQLGPGAGANPYKMVIQWPFQFIADELGDQEDLDTASLSMMPVHDETFGGAVKVMVTNTLAGL
jgi:hypothetical protein